MRNLFLKCKFVIPIIENFLRENTRKTTILYLSHRTENSDLHQTRDQVKRDQQFLARENERLARKLEQIERYGKFKVV